MGFYQWRNGMAPGLGLGVAGNRTDPAAVWEQEPRGLTLPRALNPQLLALPRSGGCLQA